MSLEERFQAAATQAKSLPNQSNESLLKLYALYKQGSLGDVSGPKPGGFDFKGKAKYDAWTRQKGKTQDAAKEEYISLVEALGK